MMRNSLVLCVLLFTGASYVSSCSSPADDQESELALPGVYRVDIQQGNIVTQDQINQLRLGMTKDQVSYIIGTPIIAQPFDSNRWDYIFAEHKRGQKGVEKHLTLYFSSGVLSYIKGDD